MRLIAALAPKETPNPLTLAGDGHQRIYRAKVPLRRAGIDIVGRSRRLKINYRTTEEIRNFGQSILAGEEIDDLDGGVTTTRGDRSLRHGPKPTVLHSASEQEEAQQVLVWIKNLLSLDDPNQRLKPEEICVTPPKETIVAALTSAGIARYSLPKDQPDRSQEAGIRLASMHRIKGLEYRAVVLACANPEDALNNLSNASLRTRCERYVAATRARDHLLISLARL